jgi:hypothetical protein
MHRVPILHVVTKFGIGGFMEWSSTPRRPALLPAETARSATSSHWRGGKRDWKGPFKSRDVSYRSEHVRRGIRTLQAR